MSDQSNIISNGELEIVKITEDLYDDAVKLFTENFVQLENICLATRVAISSQAVKEIQILCRELLKEYISFAVRNIATGELAAIAVNHLMCNSSENATLGDEMTQFESPQMKCIINFLQCVETDSGLYRAWHIDSAMEIVFLSTSPKYMKRGLASTLSQHSIDYARHILQGTLRQGDILPAHVRQLKPKAVCSVFTSRFTQRIGQRLGFEVLTKVPYTEFSFEGKTFAERIDPIHEYCTFEALRL